ncbi:MAG: sigma-54 interaction domain-containing protein [Limnohabitans sp.]
MSIRPDKTPLIGRSQAMETLRRLVKTLAVSSSTALVTGESGTGKELVAQSLHQFSPRAAGPFVPLNCGAIPRELIESELFGHRRGSFTGALADRVGRIELAHGGTLFLDEIGDLPLDMQVKLLRVLQERAILPVGASREVPVDVRVVAATHRDLEQEVKSGRFREDLYYRLNVLPLSTTPLRERSEDIAELADFYAKRHAMPGNAPVVFAPDMLVLLQSYGWPGNVRELSNLIDRFSTLFPGQQVNARMVPSCMLPSGMAVLQADMLAQLTGAAEVTLSVLTGQSRPAPADQRPTAHEDAMALLLAREDVPGEQVRMWVHPPAEVSASNDEIHSVEEVILLAQGISVLPPEGLSLKQHLVNVERSLIEQALSRAEGNVSRTARLLQLQRTTLIEKINKYDLRASG